MTTGMHRATGRALGHHAHLAQSVADIINTPIGSRVMRRTYGSLVPALLDQPHNAALAARVRAAAVSALMRWEPRIAVRLVKLTPDPDHHSRGHLSITADVRELSGRARPIELQVQL